MRVLSYDESCEASVENRIREIVGSLNESVEACGGPTAGAQRGFVLILAPGDRYRSVVQILKALRDASLESPSEPIVRARRTA